MAELCNKYSTKGELWAIYCRAVMFVKECEAADREYTRLFVKGCEAADREYTRSFVKGWEAADREYTRALQLRPGYAKLLMHRA